MTKNEVLNCSPAIQREVLEQFGEEKLKRFCEYARGVLRWNEHVNLTAITEPDEFMVKHIIDSVMCIDFPEFKEAESIIDVGTGAGFPGVPLAIAAPQKRFVLMDSLNKRLRIVTELCETIGVSNVETVHARAEEMARQIEHREMYDLCVSRAVANLAVLAEYCLPFIRIGGTFIAYKGPDCSGEVEESRRAIKLLGGELSEIRSSKMKSFGLNHNFVVIKKVNRTATKYPRKAGMPSKEPL